MAKRTFKAGATSQTIDIFVMDSSSTVGAGLAALAFNTANLKAYYRKGATGSATAITLATQTVGGAWSSGGFVEIDATNMKGVYRFDVPDTILASSPWATLYFYGATNMAPVVIELEIVAVDPFDAVRMGLTALPNAAAEAAGGLYTRGSGAGQIAQQANGQADVNLSTIKTQAVTCAAGVTVLASVGTAATSTAQTGDNFARLGAPAGASVSADVAAVKVDTAAVKVQTDKMTFTVANVMDSNMLRINGDATSAANIAKTTRAIGRGTATTAGSSTTLIATSAFAPVGVAANADQFAGRVLTFDADTTSTKLRGQSTSITSSTAAAAPVFTVVAITIAPVDGDTFSVT